MTPAEIAELRWLIYRAREREHAARIVVSCEGKVSFDNPVDAARAVRHPGLAPYRCFHCGRWHVGSSRRERKGGRLREARAG